MDILTSNDDFRTLVSEIEKTDPTGIYQRLYKTQNIHRRGGGPCPNDLGDLNEKLCLWAKACIRARQKVSDTYEEHINLLIKLLAELDVVVLRISKKHPDVDIEGIYRENYRNPTEEKINKMEKSFENHRKAEARMIRFKKDCQNKYKKYVNRRAGLSITLLAKDDLLHNYTLNDLQRIAYFFGLDYRGLNKLELATLLAARIF